MALLALGDPLRIKRKALRDKLLRLVGHPAEYNVLLVMAG
jgi:hypothetical protein